VLKGKYSVKTIKFNILMISLSTSWFYNSNYKLSVAVKTSKHSKLSVWSVSYMVTNRQVLGIYMFHTHILYLSNYFILSFIFEMSIYIIVVKIEYLS